MNTNSYGPHQNMPMNNEVIVEYKTQGFPYADEYIRIVRRYVQAGRDTRVTFTVATKNNCIQGNSSTLYGAMAHYQWLIEQHLKGGK